eukprot:gene7320-9974_t
MLLPYYNDRESENAVALKTKLRLRYIFRSCSFICLVVGFTVFNFYYYKSSAIATITEESILNEDITSSRTLTDCSGQANPPELVIAYCFGVLYMFCGLAIIADEFFVPSLDVIAEKLNLSPDVAGATLMAAGGSAPELFTSLIGTFLKSDVGFGAIVGSAVFNVLFVVGMCGILTTKTMELSWYPMARDSIYYLFVLIILAIFFGVNTPKVIDSYEAVIIHLLYYLYVYMMMNNETVQQYVMSCISGRNKDTPLLKSPSVKDQQALLNNPTKFRASIMKLFTSNKNILDSVGTNVVFKIAGTVETAFAEFDTDKSGFIDKAELGRLFTALGCELDSEHLDKAMKDLDKDGNGLIDFAEFSKWYMASEDRIRGELHACFKKIDIDGDGIISVHEVREMLITFGGAAVSDEDVDRALQELGKENTADQIDFKRFQTWFETSVFWTASKAEAEEVSEAAEGVSIMPPEEGGAFAWAWFIITWPLVLLMWLSVPDVRKPGYAKFAPVAFVMCLGWMGILSYFMVTWIETIGVTLGIPSVIMGLTFLAAGTSVPDLLSAMIVAKQGQGDKAVSSSIGSNIFDICVGLGFPWVAFWIVFQQPIYVEAGGLFISILLLALVLGFMIATVKYCKWTLPKNAGYFLVFLYFLYVAEQLATTTFGGC